MCSPKAPLKTTKATPARAKANPSHTLPAHPFPAAGENHQQNRENGGRGHQDAHVGGICMHQRGVFRQKIQGIYQPQQKKPPLLPPVRLFPAGVHAPQGGIAQGKAQHQKLSRGVHRQQLLAGGKGAAPYEHAEKRRQMA